MSSLAILGCGNMTQALFTNANISKFTDIFTYTPSKARANNLAEMLGGKSIDSLEDLPEVDYIFIGCKPQSWNELASALNLIASTKVISIMAAITIEEITKKLGTSNIYRLMPNTPVAIGKGITLLTHKQDDHNIINQVFSQTGNIIYCNNERELDQLTPLTGSGPGLIYKFMEMFSNALEVEGLGKDEANEVVRTLFMGSVELAYLEKHESIEGLRAKVTSKAGVTEAAVSYLEKMGVDNIFLQAIKSAQIRSDEISKQLK